MPGKTNRTNITFNKEGFEDQINHQHMNILVTLLIIIASVITLLLIAALFMKKKHFIKRDIVINAPLEKVFGFLRLLNNQDKFNK